METVFLLEAQRYGQVPDAKMTKQRRTSDTPRGMTTRHDGWSLDSRPSIALEAQENQPFALAWMIGQAQFTHAQTGLYGDNRIGAR